MKLKYNKLRIFAEIFIWIVFLSVQFIQFNAFSPLFINGIINHKYIAFVISNFFLISFYYLNFYYALPKLFFKKRYVIYVLICVMYLLLFNLVFYLNPSINPISKLFSKNHQLVITIFIVVRLIIVFLFSLLLYNIKRIREVEKNSFLNEINSLKSQVNPHFLFNTLNNIYALSLAKSDLTSDAILKLSNIMRYMMNQQIHDFVTVSKELEYINSYVELEKLRLPQNVKLTITNTCILEFKKIAPFIFLPFIENAFKHGVSPEENCEITINISNENDYLILLVRNKKVKVYVNEVSGFGIQNVKKRLNFLYPNTHQITTSDELDYYTVTLKLKLHD